MLFLKQALILPFLFHKSTTTCQIDSDCVHTMPEQFENGKNLDGKNSLQDFDAKEVYLHPKNRRVSFQKHRKMFYFSSFSGVYKMPFLKYASKKCAVFV